MDVGRLLHDFSYTCDSLPIHVSPELAGAARFNRFTSIFAYQLFITAKYASFFLLSSFFFIPSHRCRESKRHSIFISTVFFSFFSSFPRLKNSPSSILKATVDGKRMAGSLRLHTLLHTPALPYYLKVPTGTRVSHREVVIVVSGALRYISRNYREPRGYTCTVTPAIRTTF